MTCIVFDLRVYYHFTITNYLQTFKQKLVLDIYFPTDIIYGIQCQTITKMNMERKLLKLHVEYLHHSFFFNKLQNLSLPIIFCIKTMSALLTITFLSIKK